MDISSQESLHFSSLSGKEVRADFTGGQMTPDAGVLLLRETGKKLVLLTVFLKLSGMSGIRVISNASLKVYKLPSEKELASQPTFSRLENSIQKPDRYRIAECFVENFIASYEDAPEAIVLDLDDTDEPRHGARQLQFFNGYHDEYCFLPLHLYEGISGKLITTILRPGRRPKGKEVVSIIKRIIKRIRDARPKVGILLRGGSHFAAPEVFTWCERNNVQYITYWL